jgi:hypothetical protein
VIPESLKLNHDSLVEELSHPLPRTLSPDSWYLARNQDSVRDTGITVRDTGYGIKDSGYGEAAAGGGFKTLPPNANS